MNIARFLLSLSLLLTPLALRAQDQADLIRTLLDRIGKLERRVTELEGKGSPVAQAVPRDAAPESMAPHDATHEHGGGPCGFSTPSLRLAGYSDINFAATDQRGAKSGFSEGQFILHLSSALSSRVSYFGELSFVARTDAGLGLPPAPGFNVEVERSIIRFDQSDALKVSFGRYHTPINYWNTAYHHGSWLQTTISRPEMTQFGGSFIPVHFVGALVEGAAPAGGLNLNYNTGAGNGRSSAINRAGDWGDVNNNRALLLNLFVKPDAMYGLQAGASAYRDHITSALGNYREWITSGHFVWSRENPEIIAEVANVRHRQLIPSGSNAASNSIAYYVQAAYRLPGMAKLWKPYYRFEYIHIPKSDLVFRGVPGLKGSTAGLRYDISPFAALKFEYRDVERPGQRRYNGGFVQTSFTF